MPLNKLRIAFIEGTLGARKVEKQLFFMVRVLQRPSALSVVFSMAQGEAYERIFTQNYETRTKRGR